MSIYEDPLGRVLIEETVSMIQSQPCASVTPDTPVERVLERLTRLEISCVVVAKNRELLGIFTQRDVLDKVALQYDEVKGRPVSDVMTSQPVYVYETDATATVLCVMASSGYRHVPVLDLNDKVVGIVSPQRVVAFLQRHVTGG